MYPVQCLLLGVCSLILGYGLIFTIIKGLRNPKDVYIQEFNNFIENMRKLNVEDEDIYTMLGAYSTRKELIRKNKQLRKAIKKYKL